MGKLLYNRQLTKSSKPKKNKKMSILKSIKKALKNGMEITFEIALQAFSAVGTLGKVAKELKVSVKIQNMVETKDPLRKFSILAENTWLDLFDDKKRCQLKGFPINTTPDLLLTINSAGGKLSILTQSEYLKKTDPKTEISEAFKEFIDDANEIIDEIFNRDRSLIIDETIIASNKTKQVNELTEFFEHKISKLFFAVMVKKFIAEVSK